MRLVQLILDAFGTFTNKQFNFGEKKTNKSDFHIIYGPNEAGKTTVMKAWQRLLFGIPKIENYAFFQKRQNLKISAQLEENNQNYFLLRVPKANRSILQDANGKDYTPMLTNWLHGMSEQEYQNLLCLDDKTIEEGGKTILGSQGKMGELLFSTAAGLTNFSEQLDNLKQQADLLYKKQAKKTEFANLKKRYEEISKKISQTQITAAQFQELKQKAQSAFEEKEKLSLETNALREKIATYDALKISMQHTKQLEKIFKETFEDLSNIATKIGVKDCDYTQEKAENIYNSLSSLKLSETEKNNLEKINNSIHELQNKTVELKQKSIEIKKEYFIKHSKIENLESVLPSAYEQNRLLEILSNVDIENVIAKTNRAKDQFEDKNKRFEHALLSLTVKGQYFEKLSNINTFQELPYSPLTVQETEKIKDRISKIENDYDIHEREYNKLLGEKQNIENELNKLRNFAGEKL